MSRRFAGQHQENLSKSPQMMPQMESLCLLFRQIDELFGGLGMCYILRAVRTEILEEKSWKLTLALASRFGGGGGDALRKI